MAWAAVASMAAQAVGSLVSGIAQHGQAKSEARVADANAESAQAEGAAQADLIRERAARIRGSNRAAAGASGVDISSFDDAFDDSDINAELDAQMAIRNAKQQANNLRTQAKMSRSAGSAALIGGALGAGTKALSAGYGGWKMTQPSDAGGGYSWGAPVGGHGGAR